ncbi:hypothetical protein FRX31_009830 [Thalictrum thalictroides]|uniref:Uncharacterized protein n=1 Tax=Thalictrum thalictroides TaxID=46969 RepID=A0A7J6WV40_THATH|nr:hypothetical protein FRX31_009830 [Thalictrum thalictroides]
MTLETELCNQVCQSTEVVNGFYIGSIFFSKEECFPTTTPAIDVVNGSKDIAQPLTSSSGEDENISNNSLTQVETTSVAGEEAEIVFNNESTEIATDSSQTETIEPVSHETRVPDQGGEKAYRGKKALFLG